MCMRFKISTFSLSLITLHWSCHRCRFTYSLFKRCVFIQTRSENETIDQKHDGREQKKQLSIVQTHRNASREEKRERARKRKRSVTRYKLCLSISYMLVELLFLLLLLLSFFIDPCLLAAAAAAAPTATYVHSYNIPYE